MSEAVTLLRPRKKDPTAALRVRRYRAKKRSESKPVLTVSTIDMCRLAGRVGAGTATEGERQLVERIILQLVRMLPEDSDLAIP